MAWLFELVRRTYAWGKNIVPMFHKVRKFLRLASSSSSSSSTSRHEEEEEAIQQLSPLVIRVLGQNPGKFTLAGTNTYLVGTGRSRILIDTGEGRPTFVGILKKAMDEAGCDDLAMILLTHRHYDHIGGIKSIYEAFGKEIPTFKCMHHGRSSSDGSSDGEAGGGQRWRHYEYNAHVPKDIPWRNIADGQVFHLPGDCGKLTAIFTPGHSEDHMCFLLEPEPLPRLPVSESTRSTKSTSRREERDGAAAKPALFAGDNVLGRGTSWFEDLGDYMESLETMRRVCVAEGREDEDADEDKDEDDDRGERRGRRGGSCGRSRREVVDCLYCGHGPPVDDAAAKIDEYLSHRRLREEQVHAMLPDDSPSLPHLHAPWSWSWSWWSRAFDGKTSLQVTQDVYPGLHWKLIFAAHSNVRNHLRKLARDGRAREGRLGLWVKVKRPPTTTTTTTTTSNNNEE